MRTPGTRTPSASRTSMASGCPPASDVMVAGAHPSVAVDGIVLQNGKLVAVRRKNEPYRGMPALPGRRDGDTGRARPAWLVSAPARVAATTPNAANREIIAATPARTPAWEPAATLTHKIQTATTMRKRIDKAYGERLSGPAARTGTDGMANTNAMIANRSL